jgi:hypothetical protein
MPEFPINNAITYNWHRICAWTGDRRWKCAWSSSRFDVSLYVCVCVGVGVCVCVRVVTTVCVRI